MKKTIFACATYLFFCLTMYAQESREAWLALETDPFSTVLGAKTLSIIIEPNIFNHWSVFSNVVSADFPGWVDDFLNPKNRGKGFDSKINLGGGLAIDYFIREDHQGIYIGLINLFFHNEISRNGFFEKSKSHNVIPRVGYRWFPFEKKRLYLNPFLGMRYEYSIGEDIKLDGVTFKAAGFQPFATMHIGYHF